MKFGLLFITQFLFLPALAYSQLVLDVVYPREEQVVTAADSTFIFGSVSDPQARVRVNQLTMRVYRNGAFLGMVPVSDGDFTFECEADLDSSHVILTRKVRVLPFLATTPTDTLAIDSAYVFPQTDIELMAGDFLKVAFKGTPGLAARCSIPGVFENGIMTETAPLQEFYWGEAVFGSGRASVTPEVKGIYSGVYKIPQNVKVDTAHIVFHLGEVDGSNLEIIAPGRLSVHDSLIPQIAELSTELTVARSGPGLGYQQFLPEGVKLVITGKRGAYLRARLNDSESVWIPEKSVRLLPAGTPIPWSKVSFVRTETLEKKVRVHIYLQECLPFKIEQTTSPSGLIITVYGATSDTDWIRYDFEDVAIKNIRWRQPANRVYQLIIELNHKQQWGFNPYYENKTLVVDIKKPPKKLKLNELLVCIDPGHAPADGAVGPTRLKEKDANLQLSLFLKRKLEKKGATVFLTRTDDYGASLSVRPKLAAFVEADILLSIHHNALPDGVNPFTHRGSSTYYYHVQSQPLATAILSRLEEKLHLKNFGLFYDNLALCRPPQMPAVLVESAFIMHPEEEMLIASRKYKEQTAEAVVKGIEDFLKQARKEN
ncbi:MAG: N-acetylmuramoyl-L-alanine amidase [bacterium]